MRRGLAAGVATATLLTLGGPSGAADPAELAARLARLGPPGLLWGRLAIEEESPDGPWTPLEGVEVWVYPDAPDVRGELERVRRSARDSAREFETAVQRVLETLSRYRTRVEAVRPPPTGPLPGEAAPRAAADPPSSKEEGAPGQPGPGAQGLVQRVVTDPAGLFVFGALPAGEWLVVALRTSAYAPATPDRDRAGRLEPAFLPPKARGTVRQAEVWLAPVTVRSGAQVRLFLTDRARWLVGPLR